MEREPTGQAQGAQPELTAQGQNTYSRSEGNNMPEVGNGPDQGPTPESAAGTGGASASPEAWIAQLKSVAESEDAPAERREGARKILTGLSQMAGGEGGNGGTSNKDTATGGEGEEAPKPKRKGREIDENASIIEKLQVLTTKYGGNEHDIDTTLASSNREERGQFFNNIFLALDSQPSQFSDVLMGPMTGPGSQWDGFIQAMGRVAMGPTGAELAAKDPEAFREIKEDYEKFQKEADARKVLHDVTAILYLPGVKGETLFGYTEKFESSLVDMAFTTPGIREMVDMYEFAIRESMATHEHRGYLDPEKIRSRVKSETYIDRDGVERGKVTVEPSEIDARAIELFKEMVNKGLIKSRTKDGREFTLDDLKPWEITRIFNIARGSMIASGRIVSLAAESKLPPGPTRSASAFLQDIVQEYSALKHLNGKFGITSEALAAYLYKGTTGNVEADSLFKRWNPKELKEMWDRYHDDPEKLLNNLSNVFYLGRMNPNRAGDVWTWMSWRAENKSDAVTMVQNFLLEGEKKMVDRWNDTHETGPRAEEYIAYLDNPDFKFKFTDEEFFELSKEERNALKHEREAKMVKMKDAWKKAHPNAIGIEEFEKFYEEYQNWSGTGFRFEKMRGDLDKAMDYTQHEHGVSEAEQHKKDRKTIDDAMKLMKRMAALQGHRLYTVSEHVRKRIDEAAEKAHPEINKHMKNIVLRDVQLTESAFLNAREKILNAGIFFDQAELDMTSQGFDFFAEAIREDIAYTDDKGETHTLTRDQRIKMAKEFVGLVKEDFHHEEEHHGKIGEGDHAVRGKYFEEFVKKREYTHGFVLWTGDVPIDEYNATSVGQTGAFVRRARDNKNQGLATGAETKLLDNLKNIHNVQQLEEVFEEIFASIDHYDRSKAQQAIAEKMMGILRFYKADSLTKIPFLGLAWKAANAKNVSFARMMYGPEALALESSEINKLIRHFAHTKKITHEQERWLMDKLGATNKHLAYELGLDATELTSMAIFMQLIALIGQELAAGVQDAG